MLEFNYTDCFHYVDLDTKEVIHTVTNNDYGLGDRYTRDIVPITVDGTMYYPVFAFKNGLVAYPDKSASDIVIKCENYFVMENDIFNTWIVFCVDSANKLSTVQYQNIEDYLDRMYITTSDFSIESEDDNLLSLNITTGATGDGFASYGSTFSPTCNVEMVKSEDGDFEAYITLNSEFYVVGEVLGIKQCFGRFWINERPKIMNETFTFSGIGALDYKASNIELNVKETTEKNVELITEKYGESHVIKDWNYYWEFIERDFFDATGVPLVIPGWEELVDRMEEYHTYQLMIPYIQSSTTDETTSVNQYEFAKFNWREILSGVAVLLKRNVIEKNGSIYIEAISEEDVAINLRFNEDCYEDGSDFDNILVSPYPINVVSNRFYNNYTDSPYAYSNDTNSITTELQIPNSIYGNLVNYSVNIECPWITWELADRIHYSGYGFPVYDAYMQKNALWGQFLNIAKRFSYNPAQISFVGYHPLLSAGNLVSVESYDGAGKLIYVAEMTLSYDGGVTLSVNSKADIQTNATNSSSATSSQGSASSTSTATQSGMTNGIMYGTTIKDGVITNSKIADSTIENSKIKDGTIEGSKIADATITDSKIKDSEISGAKINFSTFEDGVIKGSYIDTSTFTDGQISGSVIDTSTFLDGTIKGSVIESSTLKDIPYASMDEAFISDLTTDEVFSKKLTAEVANLGFLTADSAVIKGKLDATELNAKVADLGYLTADSAEITELDTGIANINTLIFGSAGGSVIQSSFSNAVVAQIGDAQITSAMIKDLVANKITSGDILTNNVRVLSEDGSLVISDETIQISDDNRVRVQIGKDASNDYSINIWDANGKLMFSEGGITDKAIKDAIIRDDMVSETANISASKLNIASLFEEINDSTETIKSTRVYLDDKAQTLDVAFTAMSDTLGYTKKNLMKNTATSQTINGLTSTVNEDKSLMVKGTNTNIAQFTLSRENLKPGKYILSGGKSATKRALMQYVSKSTGAYVSTHAQSRDTEAEFEITEDEYNNYNQVYSVYISDSAGTTIDETFYPMVRKAEITDNTYEPYVDSVSDTLTSQGTTLSVLQGQISSKIWQQDITTAVDNLEIGGRNLITSSATRNYGASLTGGFTGTAKITDNTSMLSKKQFEMTCTSVGTGSVTGFYSSPYACEYGKIYTISFRVKSSTDISGVTAGFENGGAFKIDVTTEWQYFKHTFAGNSSQYKALVWYGPFVAGETFYISDVKLEEGTMATSWTPAPEDVATDINALSTKYSTLEQSLDGFKTEVGATYATLDDVATEVSAVRTIAEQTADKFSWIVEGGTSSTDFTLTDRMAQLTAEIISLNGDVKVSGDMLIGADIGGFTITEDRLTGITSEGDKVEIQPDKIGFSKLNNNVYEWYSSFKTDGLYTGEYWYSDNGMGAFLLDGEEILSAFNLMFSDLYDGNWLMQSAQHPLRLNFKKGVDVISDMEVTGELTATKISGPLNGYLKSYDTRPTSLDITSPGTGGVYKYVVGSTCTTGKPSRDAHVLHCAWDTTAGWDTQLALLNGGTTAGLQIRGQNAGTWGDWYTFIHSGNFANYAAPANTAKGIMVTCATALNLTTSWALIQCGANQASGDYSAYYTVIAGSVQVKQAGTYLISAQGYFGSGFAAGDILHLGVGVNGTGTLYDNGVPAISANPYMDISPSMIIRNLNAGDIVGIYARNQAAARGTVATGNRTRLSIIKIN